MNLRNLLILGGILGGFVVLLSRLINSHGNGSNFVSPTSTSFNSSASWIATGDGAVGNDQNGLVMTNKGGTKGQAGAVAFFPGGFLDNSKPYVLHLAIKGMFGAKALGVSAIEGNGTLGLSQVIDISDGRQHDLTIALPVDANLGIR